jgi:glyoxylase-like metal-dependent hydrolase (beta-lactamase superfamily II)
MKNSVIAAVTALTLFIQPAMAQQETSRWTALAERDWADLPAAAQDTPVPQDTGYLSREVKPGVFVVTEGLYQAMFIITRRGVVVVDAPPTIGPKLMSAIRAATDKPITHFIYSHSHIDHVGAAAQFGNVTRIASRETAAKLTRASDPNRPVATRILPRLSNRLMIDGTVFQLDSRGTHHGPGNLYISLPESRVMMVVDIIYPGWVPFTNLGMAEDVQGFIDAHDAVLSYDFDVLVGGHLSRPGTRRDVEVQQEYVRDLIASAQAGQKATNFYAVAKEIGFANRWLLVKTYMDRVADHCAKTMIDRWRTRLGGAAVSTPGHCWIMQEHLNINGLPAEK